MAVADLGTAPRRARWCRAHGVARGVEVVPTGPAVFGRVVTRSGRPAAPAGDRRAREGRRP
ncbi:hypothetical protein [Longimycelium tulufanense]|uniref:hypothetical protein n=1 Tax=Longimycelium tulufanense TaxID=907463 RepID=UPI001662BFFE|nr:hypothetical protein [Longimycelium tulufanense]